MRRLHLLAVLTAALAIGISSVAVGAGTTSTQSQSTTTTTTTTTATQTSTSTSTTTATSTQSPSTTTVTHSTTSTPAHHNAKNSSSSGLPWWAWVLIGLGVILVGWAIFVLGRDRGKRDGDGGPYDRGPYDDGGRYEDDDPYDRGGPPRPPRPPTAAARLSATVVHRPAACHGPVDRANSRLRNSRWTISVSEAPTTIIATLVASTASAPTAFSASPRPVATPR